jgi:hypothetical protein
VTAGRFGYYIYSRIMVVTVQLPAVRARP